MAQSRVAVAQLPHSVALRVTCRALPWRLMSHYCAIVARSRASVSLPLSRAAPSTRTFAPTTSHRGAGRGLSVAVCGAASAIARVASAPMLRPSAIVSRPCPLFASQCAMERQGCAMHRQRCAVRRPSGGAPRQPTARVAAPGTTLAGPFARAASSDGPVVELASRHGFPPLSAAAARREPALR